MAVFRTTIIATAIVLGTALLGTASPAISDPSQHALAEYCKTMAKAYNAANPDTFTWSEEDKRCVRDSDVQHSSQPLVREESAAQGCSGGYLSCVGRECSDFDPSDYPGGGSGAYLGCILSCAFRCAF